MVGLPHLMAVWSTMVAYWGSIFFLSLPVIFSFIQINDVGYCLTCVGSVNAIIMGGVGLIAWVAIAVIHIMFK